MAAPGWMDHSEPTPTWERIPLWAHPTVPDVPKECGSTCSTGTAKAPPMGSSRRRTRHPDHRSNPEANYDTARSRSQVFAGPADPRMAIGLDLDGLPRRGTLRTA